MPPHILVVDDDVLMRRSLGLQLEQAGYRASTAGSAEDALALAQRDRPDLVLLDMGCPAWTAWTRAAVQAAGRHAGDLCDGSPP